MTRSLKPWPLICLLACAAAQQPPISVESRVVLVPVTVTDEKGRNVDGLTVNDFRLLDNGTPRTLTLDPADSDVAPISLVIAVQSTEISAAALAKIRRIGSMIQPLITGQRGTAAVLAFDSEMHWLQDFTHSADAVKTAFAALKPAATTTLAPFIQARMLDAVMEATERMKPRRGRKMILLISESRDRNSNAKLRDVLDAVLREGVQVYSAQYSAYSTAFIAKPEDVPPAAGDPLTGVLGGLWELARLGKTNTVDALAEATGGDKISFATERALDNAIQKLGAEIHSQYILSFEPDVSELGAHRIEVSAPEHATAKIRSRRGYWQDPPPELVK